MGHEYSFAFSSKKGSKTGIHIFRKDIRDVRKISIAAHALLLIFAIHHFFSITLVEPINPRPITEIKLKGIGTIRLMLDLLY